MTTLTGLPPVQVLLSQMTPDDFFSHNKGMPTVWSQGTPLVPCDLATGRQHRGWCIIPQAVTHSLVFLKMGKIIARNMLS